MGGRFLVTLVLFFEMMLAFNMLRSRSASSAALLRGQGRGSSLRMFALRSGSGVSSVYEGGPRRFDYKKRVLTTTEGGLVRKVRVFQQVGRGGGDGVGDQRASAGAPAGSSSPLAQSKAQQRKMEKKELRLKRQADNQVDPTRKERGREVNAKLVQCLKNKDFDTAVALYRDHRDVFTYKHNFVALLNVCYKYEHLETAREIFTAMKTEHGSPVEQAYLALIRCHTARDTPARLVRENIELARGHVETMSVELIEPRLRTYHPILSAMCRQGDLAKALALTEEMIGKGIAPRAEQLGLLLTCAVHGPALRRGEPQSRHRLLAALLAVIERIGDELVDVSLAQLHRISASLRGESLQQSYARGVMVGEKSDIPGVILLDRLHGGASGGGEEDGVAVGMNLFSDHPLACYYDNGHPERSRSGGGSDGRPLNGTRRGPPPGWSGPGADAVEYEYLTIRQRVEAFVLRAAREEQAAYSQTDTGTEMDTVRETLARSLRKWNEENSGKGGASAEKGKGGGGGTESYLSGGLDPAAGELGDLPLYQELYYQKRTAPALASSTGGVNTGVSTGIGDEEATACLVEIGRASQTCPSSGVELPCVALTEQQKESVRESLFRTANSTSKGQGSAIRAFGAWLDRQAEEGKEYKYIVDGANVAYHRQNFEGGKFSFQQVKLVVEELKTRMREDADGEGGLEQGNILVLLPYPYAQKVVPNSSRHRRGRKIEYLSPPELAILEGFEKEGMLYVVPQGGNDDWFWVYATVHSLRTTSAYCITNDLMRDHREAFSGESAMTFERWRASTIMHFDFSRAAEESFLWPEVLLTRPSAFSREIHISHLPGDIDGGADGGAGAGAEQEQGDVDDELACLDAVSDALDADDDAVIMQCELSEAEMNTSFLGAAEAGGGAVFIHVPASDRTSVLCVRLPSIDSVGAEAEAEAEAEGGESPLDAGIALFE